MFGIGDIISGITNVVGNWLKGKQETQKAKLDMQLAEMQNKARLLADKESNNHAWEMANLTDKDKWLRRISFAMFSAPFIVAIFAPQHVADYFNYAIESVPLWWQKTYMAITGGVWGLSSLKNSIVGMIGEIRK